jgi:hypothetical protein
MSVQTKSMKLVLSMIMLSGDGWVSRSELSIGNSFTSMAVLTLILWSLVLLKRLVSTLDVGFVLPFLIQLSEFVTYLLFAHVQEYVYWLPCLLKYFTCYNLLVHL